MDSKLHIKRFAVAILGMVAVMLSWLLFWPTNFSLSHQLIIPFNASHTFLMFFLCNIIIVALILTTHLESPRNSNGVTAYDDQHHVFKSTEQEMHSSEDLQSTEQIKFICSADQDADFEERVSSSKSEKMGFKDIVNYPESYQVDDKFICSSVPRELMQLVEVPAVKDGKYNELASMIDGDFNKAVEEFIAEFKCQLRLQKQKSLSRRRLHP